MAQVIGYPGETNQLITLLNSHLLFEREAWSALEVLHAVKVIG